MKINEALRLGAGELVDISNTPTLDARVILQAVLGVTEQYLIVNRDLCLSRLCVKRYLRAIERRRKGEPVAYIVGFKEFWGLNFKVNRDVLIPRPETEHLVERALMECERLCGKTIRILDIGCGSGCISIAIAKELEKRKTGYSITAVDISEKALKVARENVCMNRAVGVKLLKSDICSSLERGCRFDIILSNPPYIPARGWVSKEVLWEPKLAVFSGRTGTEHIERIMHEGYDLLSEDHGVLLLEIGDRQERLVSELGCSVFGKLPTFYSDLSGKIRVARLSRES